MGQGICIDEVLTKMSDTPDIPTSDVDMVNHPPHYTQGEIECIDAIEASMTPEEFAGYLKGTVIKYMWRYRQKWDPVQDLEKAGFYLKHLISHTEKHSVK